MMDKQILKQELSAELTENILPFWMGRMTDHRGGFYGRIDGKGRVHPDEPKGLVLNARILWAFSAAYRVLGGEGYLETAERAKREIIDRFVDREYGGAFWSLKPDGRADDTKKQLYAIGFAIYGLSEYVRATGDAEALECASGLFEDIESHYYDADGNGYMEAMTRDWKPMEDVRLSDKDRNDSRTMNTHLHVMEPYTNLYRVMPSERLKERIANLIGIFTDRILCPDRHLGLFFDDNWKRDGSTVSFGHDIEASWLLWEAATVIGADDNRMKDICLKIADAADEGLCPDGSLRYEARPDDFDRHWWVQAECVVGNWNAYEISGEQVYLDRALRCWDYIKSNLICPDGEWYWSRKADGAANTADDRAGFWKCPYHNSRMCLELISRSFPDISPKLSPSR